MQSPEIRKKFLEFFEKRGHTIVPSSSLIPDDPSVLLTTAGMQQFKPYFTGKADPMKDFGSKNTASVQKSFRTSDIDEVGDESHLTFFEMLGNFSFGGYFKKEAIQYGYDFIAKEMGLTIDYVSVFEGDSDVPADEESEKIWKSIDPGITVKKFSRADNFWGPTGAEGPCGPTTEIYVKNAAGNAIEIWNIVFNEYYKYSDGKLEKLDTPGVDTGMGLERLTMVAQKKKNIFETDLFAPIAGLLADSDDRKKRIAADHARATTFLISDGVRPSNKGAGYVLRRIMRRLISVADDKTKELCETIIQLYGDMYELRPKAILPVVDEEFTKFTRTLKNGLKELERIQSIDAQSAFKLYESFGLPYEVIKDYAKEKAAHLKREDFDREFAKHQETSRAGSEAKFGGHGLYMKTGEVTIRDESEVEKVTRLHTATHLLHAGLRAVLGDEVRQDGSDITVERTRFDFRFPRKVTPEELKKVEEWVNNAIKKDLKVEWKEMSYEEAVKDGALGFFREKYPPKVKVYTMFDPKTNEVYSKEFCGGPHVEHTAMVGEFKITERGILKRGSPAHPRDSNAVNEF